MKILCNPLSRQYAPVAVGVLLVLLLPSAASADTYIGGIPLSTVQQGTVSGDLWWDSFYGIAGQPIGQPNTQVKTFTLPQHTGIQWARVYVAVYCGNQQSNYEGTARVRLDGDGDGTYERTLGTETLDVPYTFPGEGGTGPVTVNGHCNRVSSDYLMWYDVADEITGSRVSVEVHTDKNEGYTGTFDGRIKLITLVVAYDDGDTDEVRYWVNQGHDVCSYQDDAYVGESVFSAGSIPDSWSDARLAIAHMASSEGEYEFNREYLDAGSARGSYAGSQSWDVTDTVEVSDANSFVYRRSAEFFKIPLAMLTVTYPGDRNGAIRVTSSPAGADVLLDDEETGESTNTTLQGVPAGDHVVTVFKDGYREPDEKWVTVEGGGTAEVHFSLTPITGSIQVLSEPAGAAIYLDGEKQAAVTDATLSDVPVGEHTVTVKKAGYQDASETVTVEEDETAEVSFELSAAAGGGAGGTTSSGGSAASDTQGYSGGALTLYRTGTLSGGFLFVNASGYSGLLAPGDAKEYTLPVEVPAGTTVEAARLYLYSTWSHDARTRNGVEPKIFLSVNGKQTKADATYTDRKGTGAYDYLIGTGCYDLAKVVTASGDLRITVRNDGSGDAEFALYGAALAVVYRDAGAPEITYWLYEGCDALLASPEFGTTTETATTSISVPGEIDAAQADGARLYVVATAASGTDADENRIAFNDWEWFNLLGGGSSAISIADLAVQPYLSGRDNRVEIQSYMAGAKGDYLESRNVFLILGQGDTAGTASPPPARETPANRTAAATASAYPLSLTGGRVQASHIATPDGMLTLHISEGTRLLDGEGTPVTAVTIEKLTAAGAGLAPDITWVYRIGPNTASSDIPMVLAAECNGTAGSFIRIDPGSGAWREVATKADPDAATFSCRITAFGTYAFRPDAAGEADTVQIAVGRPDGGGGLLATLIDAIVAPLLTLIFGPAPVETGITEITVIEPAGDASAAPTGSAAPPGDDDETPPSLRVRSNPAGARITLDGTYLGKTTPATITAVAAGTHRVRIEHDGFRPVEQEVIVDGETDICIELFAEGGLTLNHLKIDGIDGLADGNMLGGVYVESLPAGAEIYVDGKKTGLFTPKVVYGLKEGKHTIKIMKKGALVEDGDVTAWTASESTWVYPDAVTGVAFYQGPAPMVKNVTIESAAYAGKGVTVDGRYPLHTIPCTVETDDIHPYITIFNEGRYLSHRITPNEILTTVTIPEMPPATGTVRVDSVPSGADIYLDGHPTGFCTPYLIGDVSEGPHRILVSRNGYHPEEAQIWVVPGGADPDDEITFTLGSYVYGSLMVNSTPAGAKVYLYGRDAGVTTPCLIPYLEIGTYDIKLKADRSSELVEGVLVTPYAVREIRVDLAEE
ncbi:DUF3344 domain-containing protein [Methanoculleus sp. FWC-SCC1]|uniref:DUF3344 domain-containing protein n=1 Tax=Methanoculleus frigidifontis TaxID=2584085 RepID=A0ABT8M7Z0_9EURY|nr:DUF3344 domain-containing protein [Methanoculleus sp. FWC-SCC1]MDN7024056.1 DUF3344 domain-containing protein [Methanoculleus sp. FWC-SCC1]